MNKKEIKKLFDEKAESLSLGRFILKERSERRKVLNQSYRDGVKIETMRYIPKWSRVELLRGPYERKTIPNSLKEKEKDQR